MKKQASGQRLTEGIQKLLPARLQVSAVQSRLAGTVALGTVRIYCSSDKKSFLSDFEAHLSEGGDVIELRLDGQSVRSRRFCED